MVNSSVKEMKKLIDICHSNLKNSKKCTSYLNNRGISQETISKYKIGYFPQNISKLKKYINSEFLEKSMIVNYSGYSEFSNYYYLVFPINDEYGETKAIMGRSLLRDVERASKNLPKYKNSSYKKSEVLYGLDSARSHILKHRNAFVVEGNFDVMALESNGIKNAVGICGSAFSRGHFYKLARYTDKITFILDNDDAGLKSMNTIYNKFSSRGIKLRFCRLPSGVKDVDEYFHNSNKTIESFYKDLKLFIPEW